MANSNPTAPAAQAGSHLATPPVKTPVATPQKEQEQKVATQAAIEEEKLMAEINRTAEENDRQTLEALRKQAPEIRPKEPAPEISPELEDLGVVHPPAEAQQVLKTGPTIQLSISEQTYKDGLKASAGGKTSQATMGWATFGISGLLALALWIGRAIKLAHKHATGIVFRKKE